jgi:hypothetical protein
LCVKPFIGWFLPPQRGMANIEVKMIWTLIKRILLMASSAASSQLPPCGNRRLKRYPNRFGLPDRVLQPRGLASQPSDSATISKFYSR